MRTMVFAMLLAACGDKQADDTKLRKQAQDNVNELAFETYAGWAARHVDKQCPSSLADLAAGASESKLPPSTLVDPWGKPFAIFCGKTLPPGQRGLLVVSSGPDGVPGTADDIQSGLDAKP